MTATYDPRISSPQDAPNLEELDTGGHGSGLGYFPAMLASMLMGASVRCGFDSAAQLSEETEDPRKTAPEVIVNALLVSFVGGGLMILAAPDPRDALVGRK